MSTPTTKNRGIEINRRADVGARLVVLRDLIKIFDKAMRTQAGPSLAEVNAEAKETLKQLTKLTAERDSLLIEWRALRASLGEPTEDPI
jgi:hypothetical protein